MLNSLTNCVAFDDFYNKSELVFCRLNSFNVKLQQEHILVSVVTYYTALRIISVFPFLVNPRRCQEFVGRWENIAPLWHP